MKKLILLTISSLALASASQAALVLLEDFNDVADWGSNGSGSNTLTATGGVGVFDITTNTSTSHYLDLDTNAIANNSTGTIFFQFITPVGGTTTLDHFAGFSVGDTPGPYSGYNGYIFSQAAAPYIFGARDGGGASGTTATGLTADTTYNVWMVLNNTAKTYDVYINTGTAAATAGDLVWDDLAFRTNTDPAGLAVDTFGLFGQDSAATGGTVLSFDNVYIDSSASTLVNPVPEPSTYSLLAGFLTLGAVLIRRRLNS